MLPGHALHEAGSCRPHRGFLGYLLESVATLESLPTADLSAFHDQTRRRYDAFRQRGLALDLTRGKPSSEQLDLSNGLLGLPGEADYKAADGAGHTASVSSKRRTSNVERRTPNAERRTPNVGTAERRNAMAARRR